MSSRRIRASREAIDPRVWKKMLRQDALGDQNGRCLYCLSPMRHTQATAEHKLPRSQGGKLSRQNIGASCLPCNAAKADATHGAFLAIIERRSFPRGAAPAVIMIWASRRIFKRAQMACVRIERSVR